MTKLIKNSTILKLLSAILFFEIFFSLIFLYRPIPHAGWLIKIFTTYDTQKMNVEEHLLYQVIEQIDAIGTDNGREFYLTNIRNQLTRKQSLLLKETMQQIKDFNLHPIKINTSKELQMILATKKEVKIIEKNLYLYEKNYEDAKSKIIDLLKKNSKVTLAQVRDFLGINRKVAQFILENMDEEHITIRQDEYRILFK